MKTKILVMLWAWLVLVPWKGWSQCNATSANAINRNGSVSGGTLNSSSPSLYNPSLFTWPFLSSACVTGVGAPGNKFGPFYDDWRTASGTPDANHLSGYVAAMTTVSPGFCVYENFSTFATLQPNTSYTLSFRVAVRNETGSRASVIQIVNRNDGDDLYEQCSGFVAQLPVNGLMMFNRVIPANTPAGSAPVFQTFCGTFRTGSIVSSDIILFRIGISGVNVIDQNTPNAANYVYIDDFFITPTSATCLSPVTITQNCNGTGRTLTATLSPANPNATYQWLFNGTPIAGATGSTYVLQASANTVGIYSVSVQSPGGCNSIANTLVDLNQPPVATIANGCAGNLLTANLNPANSNATYQWRLNGVDIVGAIKSTFRPTQPGNYTVVIGGGCSVASAAVAVTPTTVGLVSNCINGNRTLTATSSNNLSGYIYRWYMNNGLIPGNAAVYSPTISGTYVAEYFNSATGCSIRSNPVTIVVPYTAITESCVAGGKVLSSNITPTPAAPTYQWYLNGNAIAGATQSTYSATLPGIYRLGFTTDNDGCVYSSGSYGISILNVTLNTPTLNVLCQNQTAVSLTATRTGGLSPFTYAWTGPVSSLPANQTISINTPGTYTVTVTDAMGCTATAATTVIDGLSVTCPAPICPGGTPTLQLSNSTGLLGNYVAGWYSVNDLSPNPELKSTITVAGDYYAVVVSPVCTLKTQTPCHISFLAAPNPIVLSQSGSGFGCTNTLTNITVTNPGINDIPADGNYFNDGVIYQWNTGEINDLNSRTVTGYGSWSISAQNTTTGCITTSNSVGLSGPQLSIERTCVNGTIVLNAGANFATGVYHWYIYNPTTGVRTEITNPTQLSNGGASLTVLTAGIYIVTNDATNNVCPGVEARIYENMVTSSPGHANMINNTDGQFDNLTNCSTAKGFTSGLAGCIDRSAYIPGNSNYIDPASYGVNLPDHYMINQPGLTANAWNPGYWQGTGYNSETFMIVDGQPKLSETVVWSLANVPVTSGYNYLFKAFVRNISANASSVGEEIPTLYLRVRYNNGSSYAERRQVIYRGGSSPQWVELKALSPALAFLDASYNVIHPTTATIEIVVDGGNIVGRDLGIDNITFAPYGLCDAVETACGSYASIAVTEKTVCLGSSVTFTVLDPSTDPNLQYNWTAKNSPGVIIANTKNFTVSPTVTTEYVLTVTNTQMLCSFSKTVKANVISSPVPVNAGPDVTICQGLSAQLNASGAVSYDWGNLGSVSNRYIPNPMANPLATQVYTLTGRDASGCVTTDQVTVTVLPAPLISVNPNITICQNGAGSLKATNAVSYVWSPANGLSSTTVANPIASPAVTTTYTVTGTRDNGCTASRQVVVNVTGSACNIPVFDGTDDVVTVPYNPAYSLGTGDFTIEAWVQYSTGSQRAFPTIISTRPDVSGENGFFLGMMSGTQIIFQIAGVNYFSSAMPNIYDGVCHHIAVRRSGTLLTFFRDGIAIGTSNSNLSINPNPTTGSLRIGRDRESTTPMRGAIQEVRFWNVARTNPLITTNMATVFNPSTPNLIGYWRFKQTSGQVVPDESAFRNDGVYGTTSAVEVTDPQLTIAACAPLRTPENPAGTSAGLRYKYYEGNWSLLPNFDVLTPVKSAVWSNVSLGMQNRGDNFGVTYTGFITVAVDGYYTFFTNSDDGSRLFIGNTLVVDNDGPHGPQERFGTIGLKAGVHAFKVTYFEMGGGEVLEVRYSGPGISKQIIPNTAYVYNATSLRESVLVSEDQTKVSIYPNPFEQTIKVMVQDANNTSGSASIKLTNLYGLEVYSGTVLVNQENELSLDLPAGIYLATVTLADGKSYQIKIVKTN